VDPEVPVGRGERGPQVREGLRAPGREDRADPEPQPLDPKEASRWITSQMRARQEKETRSVRPTDPDPLDPAEASRLIAERIRAKGKTAVRPVEPLPDEILLARPIGKETLLALLQTDASTLARERTGDAQTVKADPLSFAEFEFLVLGGRRRDASAAEAPPDDGAAKDQGTSRRTRQADHDSKTRLKRRDAP